MNIIDSLLDYMKYNDKKILITTDIKISNSELNVVVIKILSWLKLEHRGKFQKNWESDFLLEKDFEDFKYYITDNNLMNIVTLRGSLLNYAIATELIDKGIAADGRDMKDNPLVCAIGFSNLYLVEELMKKYRNLIVTYSNEYVRDCTILDIAQRTKNDKVINIVKRYLN